MSKLPKAASARRRTNSPKPAMLYPVDMDTVVVPELPARRQWQPETIRRWESLHTSPMAAELVEADLYNLYDLAELWDDYTKAQSSKERAKLSREIRIKGQAYGLSPLDRRRLSWEIEKGEQAEIATRQRRERLATQVEEDEGDAYASLG